MQTINFKKWNGKEEQKRQVTSLNLNDRISLSSLSVSSYYSHFCPANLNKLVKKLDKKTTVLKGTSLSKHQIQAIELCVCDYCHYSDS